MGKHPVGFEHLFLILIEAGRRQQIIDRHPQHPDRSTDALDFGQRIVGHRVGDHHARLVQPDVALGGAFLPDGAPDHHRLAVQRADLFALAQKGTKLGHLGQHHRHHFQRIDRIIGKLPRLARLHHQHAQLFADPLDRHPEERAEDLFAGLGHEAKALFRRRIGGVDRARAARDPPYQPFAQAQPGVVHRGFLQPLGGAQLERLGIAKQVDRAHLGAYRIGDQMGDTVQPVLTLAGDRQAVAQPPQQLAAFTFAVVGHHTSAASALERDDAWWC